MYEVNKDFYPNDSGWLGYGNVSKLCIHNNYVYVSIII